MSKKRQPRELLTRILEYLPLDCNTDNASAKQEVYGAWADAYTVRDGLPPDPPKRHYFGRPGSLTYSHHRKH